MFHDQEINSHMQHILFNLSLVCAGSLPLWKLKLRGCSRVHLATAGAALVCLGCLPTLGGTSTNQVKCSGTVSWGTTGTECHRTIQVKNQFMLQSINIIRTLSRPVSNTYLWLLGFSHILCRTWRWRLQCLLKWNSFKTQRNQPWNFFCFHTNIENIYRRLSSVGTNLHDVQNGCDLVVSYKFSPQASLYALIMFSCRG